MSGPTIRLIVRLILTAALLVGVYSETGVWTTITFGLLSLAIEVMNVLIAKVLEVIK